TCASIVSPRAPSASPAPRSRAASPSRPTRSAAAPATARCSVAARTLDPEMAAEAGPPRPRRQRAAPRRGAETRRAGVDLLGVAVEAEILPMARRAGADVPRGLERVVRPATHVGVERREPSVGVVAVLGVLVERQALVLARARVVRHAGPGVAGDAERLQAVGGR